MKKRKFTIIGVALFAMLAVAAILWPMLFGVRVDTVILASYTAKGEENPELARSVTIKGRAYLKPFSRKISRFHGLFRVEEFGEDGPEEVWIEFNRGGSLPSSWIENGEFRTNQLSNVYTDGLFDRLLIVVYAEGEEGWSGDQGPFLSYPGMTRTEMNTYLVGKMGSP